MRLVAHVGMAPSYQLHGVVVQLGEVVGGKGDLVGGVAWRGEGGETRQAQRILQEECLVI